MVATTYSKRGNFGFSVSAFVGSMMSNWKIFFFLLHPFGHKVLFVSCSQTWQSSGGQVVGTASMTDAHHDVRSIQDFSVSAATLLIVGM